jgi:hypothetical protein
MYLVVTEQLSIQRATDDMNHEDRKQNFRPCPLLNHSTTISLKPGPVTSGQFQRSHHHVLLPFLQTSYNSRGDYELAFHPASEQDISVIRTEAPSKVHRTAVKRRRGKRTEVTNTRHGRIKQQHQQLSLLPQPRRLAFRAKPINPPNITITQPPP